LRTRVPSNFCAGTRSDIKGTFGKDHDTGTRTSTELKMTRRMLRLSPIPTASVISYRQPNLGDGIDSITAQELTRCNQYIVAVVGCIEQLSLRLARLGRQRPVHHTALQAQVLLDAALQRIDILTGKCDDTIAAV